MRIEPAHVVRGPRIKVAPLILTLIAVCATPAAASEPLRILAFGDSLVAGYGLPAEDGFVARLQGWAETTLDRPVEIANAGVSGDTSAGGLARLDWALAGGSVDAIIVELGANDALRGIDPAETRRNLRGILERLDAEGIPALLAGMKAPRNLGVEYIAEFDAIYPELAGEFDVVLMPFFLEGVAGVPAFNQSDAIHPNADGVDVIVNAIAPLMGELIGRTD